MKDNSSHSPKNMHQEPKPGLRQKIPIFIKRIESQDQHYETQFSRLQQEFLKKAEQQIKAYFLRARENFAKSKKKLNKELTTLRYYEQHPEENHNLYPLLVQIDEKFIFNINLIQESSLRFQLPFPTKDDLNEEVLIRKLNIYESYIRQLGSILSSESVKKYCKKEAEAGQKVMSTLSNLLISVKQTIYSPQVKLKKHFEELVGELSRYKHVEKASISVICLSGILEPAGYHQLVEALAPNRPFLSELRLKLMDMQFSQQKADILRRRLSQQFKHLKVVSIHNYYKQCKLGMFEDFNWAPYRKQVHITAGVW